MASRRPSNSSEGEVLNHLYDVFLSYASADRPVVSEVAERLRSEGLRVWFDSWEIAVEDSIPARIEAGLERSATLVLFMTYKLVKKQ